MGLPFSFAKPGRALPKKMINCYWKKSRVGNSEKTFQKGVIFIEPTTTTLILGYVVGIIIGFIIAYFFVYAKRGDPVGTLKVETSDPDGPYLFLELKKDVSNIYTKKYVTFKVDTGGYLSQK